MEKKLDRSSVCVSSPAKPMRESVSSSTTGKRIPASAAAAISAARYTNQECVFLQMIKSIPFWQDLLEHASLFYAIPSLSSGSIYQPAGALSPNGDCSLVCTWYKGTIMMHVDSLQRYWHRNKELTLAAYRPLLPTKEICRLKMPLHRVLVWRTRS